MAKVTVDGIEVDVPNGVSVLQACEAAGKEIPRFCYHERLSVAGNCRMCLVEVEKAPKPIASCAYPVADGMKVFTDSPMVRNGRRGVMEFLLINHPLDCPICDQGGECDLQDQALGYGLGSSRFAEAKRSVKDKWLGPLVKTIMTRCIHCTRCIRFATEIAGVPELGATARGEAMEVGTYVEKALTTELSGNLIDICPVGALTSRPYAFVSRPWELRNTDSVDVHDALGSNIRVDARGPEVLRILPRNNDDINEEWLADRARFSFDGLKRRRLDRPWVRVDGKLKPATWPEAFAAVAAGFRGRVAAVAGDLADAEAAMALRDLVGEGALIAGDDGAVFDSARRDFYTFNTTVAGIDDADALLIIGSDVRREAPVLNARIRKRALAGRFRVGIVGPVGSDPTYAYSATTMDAGFLNGAERPMVVLGRGALRRPDGAAVQAAAWAIAREAGTLRADWHGFNLLHLHGGQVAPLDLDYRAAPLPDALDAVWLLGANPTHVPAGAFVVFQGHHGEAAAARADVILPGAAYTEKDATWVNTEGRVQRGRRALFPPGEAREDWRIVRAASAALGRPLPYDTLEALRERLVAANPVFGVADTLERRGCNDPTGPAAAGVMTDAPFVLPIQNYWQADAISRASATMAECARTYLPMPLAAE